MGLILGVLIVIGLLVIVNKLWCFRCRSKVCLVGKTALITGGASGLGYQTAIALAAKGCRVIIADISNASKVAEEMRKESHNSGGSCTLNKASFLSIFIGKYVDLGSFKSVRAFAKEITETETRLDILVCNAGILGYTKSHITEDGLERTMQVNYFGHFLLVHLLLDLLKKSRPSRIIFTSSLFAYISNLTIDNLTPPADFFTGISSVIMGGTYANSKLCCTAAAKSFGEKLKDCGVTANAVQVGGVKTPIYFTGIKGNRRLFVAVFVGVCVYVYGKTAEQGAQTLIHLAHSSEVASVTGHSFFEGMRFWHPPQLTDEFCSKLWTASVKCTKLEADEVKC